MIERYTVFLHVNTTPAWLALPRPERRAVIDAHLRPLLITAAPSLTFRWFDAEAFSADPTDIAMIDTESLTAWYDLYEGLRDTPLWTVPYFETRQIVVAVEDGFDGYEARTA
jgi:hypothetical protein